MTRQRKPHEGLVPGRARFGFRVSLIRHLLFRGRRVIRILPSLVFLLCGLGIVGCTTEKKQKWLNFFFDGVPKPGAETNAPAIVYDENGRPLDKVVVVQTNAPL